jgi:WD40 repeat protein
MRNFLRLAAILAVGCPLLLSLSAQEKTDGRITFKGHTEAIYSVAFNKDGTRAATASFDKSVRLWDPATGKQLREFSGTNGHQSLVLSVAFHPNGDQIASGGSDNTARVWDVPLSMPVREFVHAAGVTALAVSPDGKTVAGAAKDGSVKLWSAADGKPIATITAHKGGATGVAFSANSQVLATCGADGAVRFWNPADGKPIASIGAHGSAVNGVAISPAGNQAYSIGEDGLLKSWQFPVPASKSLPAHTDAITALYVSADGNSALTGGADKSVKLSNAANGQLTREYTGATGAVSAVTLWPNNSVVAAGTSDGKVFLWTADGKPAGTLAAHTGAVTGIAVNANGNGFVTVGGDGVLRSWSYPVNASKSTAQPDRVMRMTLSPDGKRLITAGADKVVRTWAFPAVSAERQFTGHTAVVNAAAITPDNNTILSVGDDETIRVWNATNGTQTATLAGHAGAIHTLAIAPSGQFAATGGNDGLVKIWALPVTAPKVYVHPDAVTAFAMSPDGNRILTVAADKQARIWNLAQPTAERTYNLGGQAITAVAFAADNATVALAAADKTLSIRNGDKEVKKITLPAEARAVAFNSNGATVAVGFTDNNVRLFAVGDGKEAKTSAAHTAAVTALAYTPKGDLILTAGVDKTVRIWDAAATAAKGKIDLAFAPHTLSISKDGSRIAAAGEKSVALFTLADNKSVGTITTPADVKGVALSADGQRVAVACADNRVRVYGPDLKLQEVFVHDGAATGVAFHPDGKRIVSTSADKSLRLWNPALVAQAAHSGPVRQLFVTPDSARILSVGDDKHLRIWDAKTGKEQKAIAAGDGAITGLSLTADAAKAATAGADKSAKVWTLADGKAVATVSLAGAAHAVAISPNGARLAVAYTEGSANKLRVYDATSGRDLQALPDAAGPVRSLLFLADNRTLLVAGDDKNVTTHDVAVNAAIVAHTGGAVGVALNPATPQAVTAGADKTIKLWDLTTGKESKTIATLGEAISNLAVSRDFALVGVTSGKTAKVIQVGDGKEVASIAHPVDVVSINLSADKTRLITGGADNLARVWEVQTGRLLQIYSHAGAVRGVAFHPSQPLVVTASADKTAAVQPFALTRSTPVSTKPLRAIVMTPDSARLVITGDNGTVHIINAANSNEERKIEGASGAQYAIALSKNVQVLATAGADKTVRIYTFNDGKEIGKIAMPAPVRGLSFSADARLCVGVGDDKSVTAWSVAFQPGQPIPEDFGKEVQRFAHDDAAIAATITEKGELFTGSADKTVKQWKVAANAPTRNFAHPNLVDAVAWSPDGKLLATACHDGIVRIFDIEKNAVAKTINAHTTPQPSPVYSVTWTADGKQLLSTSFDKSMKLWDANSGNLVREFKAFAAKGFEKGHQDQVFCAAITKDGKLIASGSSDRRIKLWNAADGNAIREFPHPTIKGEPGQSHPGGIYQLRFSPDEKYLVSVGPAPKNRGYVAVWNVADGKLIAGAEHAIGPVFGLALSPDGKSLLLGCGPKVRQLSEAEAMIIPLPLK